MLEMVKDYVQKRNIRSVVVASTKGNTGVRASEVLKGCNVVIVTHSTGFHDPNVQELTEENRNTILTNGAKIVTTTHALGGIGRAVRIKFNTMQVDEIIAHILRFFGPGMKVAVEIVLMAADAGLIRTDEDVIAIGKYDTAIVVHPTNAMNLFDLKIKEILCKPLSPQ
ncbi:MAG: pyruvate kinase alpha/beta domain-containing protein [Candidatus Bathyarchaeota archaeon]